MLRPFVTAFWMLVATLAMSHVAAAQGLPVIPGASGFGIDTPAGRGGEIYRVTNLNDSGNGSLRACAEAAGPRVCVFEVSGAIWLSDRIMVNEPNLTIAGQTAPSPGIELRNGMLVIRASDVLVQHIRIRVGDDPSGADWDNRDALQINGNNGLTQNVVIDHSSFSWSIDEMATLYFDWDNITLSNNIFSEALHDSFHSDGAPAGNGMGHSKAILFNDAAEGRGRVSFIGNILTHNVDRNPRTKASDVVVVNNIIYNAARQNATISSNGAVGRTSLVGNIFLEGPDSDVWVKSIRLQSLTEGSQVYIQDNIAPELVGTDQWTMVTNATAFSLETFKVSTPPVWPVGLVARPTADNNAYDWVLSNAGARPADRDSVDRRAVNNIRNRNGQYINCISDDGTSRCSRNAGGWPQLAENSRPLTLPNNPSADDDGDGYTNLEEWLHQMAADLEGGSGTPSDPVVAKPRPPSSLDIS